MTDSEINKMAKELQVGDRFYYTGDMANIGGFGTVVERHEDPKWGLSYTIVFDEPRCEGDNRIEIRTPASGFKSHPGQRFKTMAQYKAERDEMLARYSNAC